MPADGEPAVQRRAAAEPARVRRLGGHAFYRARIRRLPARPLRILCRFGPFSLKRPGKAKDQVSQWNRIAYLLSVTEVKQHGAKAVWPSR